MLTRTVLALALVERIGFLLWGAYQDANMLPKFTDIDYMVFTDAAQFISYGGSPYMRDTYRYTPLLAWILLPTAFENLFTFGKLVFVAGDLLAGYLMIRTFLCLKKPNGEKYTERDACLYSSIWLLNPMVAAISTRGSSEGLLGAIVMMFLWLATTKRFFWSGVVGGLAIHFKIYPFIYVPTVLWWMGPLFNWNVTIKRISFMLGIVLSFFSFSILMFYVYGAEYLDQSWIYHLIRLDHRHNFSAYSTILYYTSATGITMPIEHYVFVPQLLITAVILPLAFARRNLMGTMAIQTVTFVTFNKVCTSQYFIWYILLVPFLLPNLTQAGHIKWLFLAAWVAFQGFWLSDAYKLEFLGQSVFYPNLFYDTLLFFGANVSGICYLIYCL
ncbi:glycosylphosphatidylinositol-alpha 1,4 mannosyltransferase I [Starmerella bacillaris]|uniref:GPI mannosyltransferase 1 n=1 Tax=Starmerella bacillaris TaxID=1247836 RepID=A0AAV5RD04_STABA|nr:glycosylphosphatidylinositol-alpha 1,4 mannosyltransferase I [Starmerella bacillaris]